MPLQLPDRPTDYLALLRGHVRQEEWRLLLAATEAAAQLGVGLYLVGGGVRDLLLGRSGPDLDLVVEGDALRLAEILASNVGARAVFHRHFGTAKLRKANFVIDIATARAETYAHPGALPTVTPGILTDDLLRRDFTINAMAICLAGESVGGLVDPFGGMRDLAGKLVRVLHPRSFIDDATRIWRAARYEQRLDFHIEAETETLLRRDVGMLKTISGPRLRRELELTLLEEVPESILARLDDLGALAQLSLHLRGDGWLTGRFPLVRLAFMQPDTRASIYMALLVYRAEPAATEELIASLSLTRRQADIVRATSRLRGELSAIERSTPGGVVARLQSLPPEAIAATAIANDGSRAGQKLHRYLESYRYVQPYMDSQEIRDTGVPAGPLLGEALAMLRAARLEGKTGSREEEDVLLKRWLAQKGIVGQSG